MTPVHRRGASPVIHARRLSSLRDQALRVMGDQIRANLETSATLWLSASAVVRARPRSLSLGALPPPCLTLVLHAYVNVYGQSERTHGIDPRPSSRLRTRGGREARGAAAAQSGL